MRSLPRTLTLAVCCFAQLCSAQTRSAQDLINDGNVAAHSDNHAQAIKAYEQAIQLDPTMRDSLLLKLGQQYLWSDKSAPAAKLLGEYVTKHPTECSPKSTYALALSWSNQLRLAEKTYREIQGACPDIANDARMGEARVLRWRDHQQSASRLYREVIAGGTPTQQSDARLGLALSQLGQDYNRTAREAFRSFAFRTPPDAGAVEGLAVSELHLGLPDRATEDIRRGAIRSPQLDALTDQIRSMQRPDVDPTFLFFHDADGTTYYGGEIRSTFPLTARGRGAAFFGYSVLNGNAGSISGKAGGGSFDYRFNETFAIRAEGRGTRYDEADFSPFTGEFDAIITPNDRQRIDLAVARITIWDNQAALFHHLEGTFGSIGLDQRLTASNRVSLAFSDTAWSEDNRRLTFRVTPAHQFEGVPRITISLPMFYETYDHGFNFGLFSPTSYTELTPAIDVYFRHARIWSFNFGGRIGGQKEQSLGWKPLGAEYARAERDLRNGWALQAMVSHSSSNVASSSGFSRTSVTFGFTRKF